jgi:hypothetical protein
MAYETENLRVRLTEPAYEPRSRSNEYRLKAPLIVENKREVTAWIDARRSCTIDSVRGAENLLFADAVLPAKTWTKIAHRCPSFITVSVGVWLSSPPEESPPAAGSQRVLLHVDWDDGQSESVDLTYEVTVR